VGRPLGLDIVRAAEGIFRIVNAKMANAIRRVSSQAGLDPREFTLVVYGGNGPVHAGKQAEELGIRKMLIPKTSPAFSALGLLLADYGVDLQRSYITPAGRMDTPTVAAVFAQMEAQAESELAKAGLRKADIEHRRFLNLCYPGQTFDLSVPVAETSAGDRVEPSVLAATVDAFHDLHEALHTYAVREEEPTLRAVRLQATGRGWKPALQPRDPVLTSAESALRGRRPAFFDGCFVDTPVYDGERLACGHRLTGPAIVEERFTTLVLYPGHSAELDTHGNYAVTVA
jgi:N-methylhydantoinase A